MILMAKSYPHKQFNEDPLITFLVVSFKLIENTLKAGPLKIWVFFKCEPRASRDHFFLSLHFHELWCRVMSICLLTEVKRQWAMLVLGWETV